MSTAYTNVVQQSIFFLKEKISAGHGTYPLTREGVQRIYGMRFNISFVFDEHMLHYALLAMSPYLAVPSAMQCRHCRKHYEVHVALSDNDNAPFFFFFFLASFVKKNMYYFWKHGRKVASTNVQHSLHLSSRSLSFERFYDSYFVSLQDPNWSYNVRFDLYVWHGSALRNRLGCSLLCVPFSNKLSVGKS